MILITMIFLQKNVTAKITKKLLLVLASFVAIIDTSLKAQVNQEITLD